MILLTSLLHREDLRDILFRWMSNNLLQEDCEAVKGIVNFNVHIVNLYLDRFSRDLFNFLSGGDTWTFEVSSKGELKDFVLERAPYTNERLDYLKGKYKKYPEDFYRSVPFRGKIYCSGGKADPFYLGHSRIKRFRRVAEKASRRMVEITFDQIRMNADALAAERASQLGIPKEHLVTPVEKQREEFAHAERRFLKHLRAGLFHPNQQTINSARIQDVAGVKAIVEGDRIPVLEKFFRDTPDYSIAEKEQHVGNYDAVNYIICVKLDKKALIDNPPDSRAVDVLSARGMERGKIVEDYKTFVETGEDYVYLELIASNYSEMIESEFGRCMHEERILAQREQAEYKSSIARNVRYITEYLFLFAISGKTCPDQLPVRLWEKTMPDTYDHAIRALWDIPTMPVL
jgi:hypothetical protein